MRLRLQRETPRLDQFILLWGALTVPLFFLTGHFLVALIGFATMVQAARDQAARQAAS